VFAKIGSQLNKLMEFWETLMSSLAM